MCTQKRIFTFHLKQQTKEEKKNGKTLIKIIRRKAKTLWIAACSNCHNLIYCFLAHSKCVYYCVHCLFIDSYLFMKFLPHIVIAMHINFDSTFKQFKKKKELFRYINENLSKSENFLFEILRKHFSIFSWEILFDFIQLNVVFPLSNEFYSKMNFIFFWKRFAQLKTETIDALYFYRQYLCIDVLCGNALWFSFIWILAKN